MKCKYLRIRQHKYVRYFYCKLLRQQVILTSCKNCLELKCEPLRGIKNKTTKQIKLENNRFSILTNDLSRCYICGKLKNDLHEIYGGSNRKISIQNGFVVPLCRLHHQDDKVISKLKVLMQEKYEETNTREDFIKLIGKSYIK